MFLRLFDRRRYSRNQDSCLPLLLVALISAVDTYGNWRLMLMIGPLYVLDVT